MLSRFFSKTFNLPEVSAASEPSPGPLLHEETGGSKLVRKSKENPFFPIAMTGFVAVVLYGAYKFKTRDKNLPLNLYIIQIRVAAQGMAVATLTCGMAIMLSKRLYSMYKGTGEEFSKYGR